MISSTDSFINVINKKITHVTQIIKPNIQVELWLISNFSKLISLIEEFKMIIDCCDMSQPDAFS